MDKNSYFKGKKALVTGASGGIGKTLSIELARLGSDLIITGRNRKALEETAAEIKKVSEHAPLIGVFDVSDRQAIFDFVKGINTVDILINNAGVGLYGEIAETKLEDINTVFGTNFFGPVNFIQALYPSMKRRGAGQIINISSTSGIRAWPGNGYYCATKHALNAITESLRIEARRHGVKVSLIMPDQTRTGLLRNSINTNGKILAGENQGMVTDYVASKIINAIISDSPRKIIGLKGLIISVINKFSPSVLDKYMEGILKGSGSNV